MYAKKIFHEEYNFYEKIGKYDIRIASLSGQLTGNKKMFLYIHFPYSECSSIELNLKDCDYERCYDEAVKIIKKTMYKYMQNISDGLREPVYKI